MKGMIKTLMDESHLEEPGTKSAQYFGLYANRVSHYRL